MPPATKEKPKKTPNKTNKKKQFEYHVAPSTEEQHTINHRHVQYVAHASGVSTSVSGIRTTDTVMHYSAGKKTVSRKQMDD